MILSSVPIIFLVGILRARLARSSIGDLLVDLKEPAEPGALRDALARALRDPTPRTRLLGARVRVLRRHRRPARRAAGRHAGRVTTFVERGDTRIAALIHDASLGEEPQLVGAVTSAAGIALENERLQADLRARLSDLRASRARIVEAGDTARRKLERDLHDGAQQRLVSISIVLRVVAGKLPDGAPEASCSRAPAKSSPRRWRSCATSRAASTRRSSPTTACRSRWRASPPARRSASRSTSSSPSARRPQLEVAAYYLIAEGLTNVAKYAEAESAKIAIMRENGSLIVELTDDGKGGADPDGRLRPARARRPRRGARRAPEDLEPAGGRNTTESGDPMRVVLADDTMLLREGVAMLLGEAGFDVAGQAGNAEDLIVGRRRAQARGRDRRPADAADPHRRGPAGRAGDPRASIRRSACSCSPSTPTSGWR